MLEKRGCFFDLNQKRKGFGNFFNKLFASTTESSYLCIVKKKKTKKQDNVKRANPSGKEMPIINTIGRLTK